MSVVLVSYEGRGAIRTYHQQTAFPRENIENPRSNENKRKPCVSASLVALEIVQVSF